MPRRHYWEGAARFSHLCVHAAPAGHSEQWESSTVIPPGGIRSLTLEPFTFRRVWAAELLEGFCGHSVRWELQIPRG